MLDVFLKQVVRRVLLHPVGRVQVVAIRFAPFFPDDLVPLLQSLYELSKILVFAPPLNHLNRLDTLSKHLLYRIHVFFLARLYFNPNLMDVLNRTLFKVLHVNVVRRLKHVLLHLLILLLLFRDIHSHWLLILQVALQVKF